MFIYVFKPWLGPSKFAYENYTLLEWYLEAFHQVTVSECINVIAVLSD